MDELDRLGMADNTIVIVFGDHGWNLGEHGFVGKHTLMTTSTRVPLMIRVPGMAKGVSKSMVELVDIYPTICDLCGIDAPVQQLDGKSLTPILRNPSRSVKREVYVQWQGGDNLQDNRFNYAEWQKSGNTMLFDHNADRDENANVSGNADYAPTVNRMSKEMKKVKKFAFRKKWTK